MDVHEKKRIARGVKGRFVRGCLALLGLWASASCGGARPTYDYTTELRVMRTYTVGPGDVLEVRVWHNEQLSRRVTVRPDGFITLPLVGDIVCGGKTVEQIGKEITEKGQQFYTEPLVVSVEVAELHSYRIYVLGEVTRPGEFTPTGQVTVLQAIALAGGFTRFAAPNEIVIVRKDAHGERRIPFAFTAVVKGGDLRENLPLLTNDTVVVP
ncbi:polysaccharide biosynthesis/export family protein [Polyangium mundeleinium]|uniref:Polysaccharide biosynthesis/export family protein n=1 Tax=Polyangium mundeleinium TaxID=2995306 RepID=A0ABT5EUU8_9BACT|nr:polysaccharide biosynthesis/export family protein [Polyangium mundeleinium]MDC0745102.1 polysaccharide biosynthesis/export family protein [Polyangium mundeleinium]